MIGAIQPLFKGGPLNDVLARRQQRHAEAAVHCYYSERLRARPGLGPGYRGCGFLHASLSPSVTFCHHYLRI